MNLYAENLLRKVYEEDETLRIGTEEMPSEYDDIDPREEINKQSNQIDLDVRRHADTVAANDAYVLQNMVDQIDRVMELIGNVQNNPSSLGSFLPSEATIAISDEKLKRDINNLLKQQSRGIADALVALSGIKARIQGIGSVQVGSKIADPTGELDKK